MLQKEVQGVRKKTSPINICVVILDNNDIRHELHLFLDVLLATSGNWTNQRALVDPRAQVNLISQLLVKKSGWTPLEDVHISVASWKSHEFTTYEVHELTLCMTNSNNYECKTIKHFIVVEIDNCELLLRLSWV